MESIVFGGGCFWCTEAVFQELKGVESVMSGYSGVPKAEVIKIEYDVAHIKFHDLLTVFFATHDPTTTNRQGADVGPQYRSMILYTNDTQKQEAETFIKKLNDDDSGRPVVTELKPLEALYEAEAYHH